MSKKWTSYREVLSENFSSRKKKNPNYSLRAFARDIGLSASRLSEIMNMKAGLSTEKAVIVCEKLQLTEPESMRFLNLVESQHGRSFIARKMAKTSLEMEDGFDEDLELPLTLTLSISKENQAQVFSQLRALQRMNSAGLGATATDDSASLIRVEISAAWMK